MNYLKTIFITLTIGFISNVVAEWVEVAKYEGGGTAYLEIDTIKKADGYVYYWTMTDNLVPDEYGTLSAQVYIQGDCNKNRVKTLSYVWFTRNMGRGDADQQESINKNWKYPSPGTLMLSTLNKVCSYID